MNDKKSKVELPMSETEWQKLSAQNNYSGLKQRYVGQNMKSMSFKTVFPNGVPDLCTWFKHTEDKQKMEAWKQEIGACKSYSRFDSVKEYLRRKLFKVTGPVELLDGKTQLIW